MSSPFQGCRDRINRAYAHRKALGELWSDLCQKDFYRVRVYVKDDGTGCITVMQWHDLPAAFSLELGEALYNFRAALDGCLYQAAIIESGQNPPPGQNRLEFPSCSSPEEFRKAAWKIDPLSEQCRNFIESVQPYNTPELEPQLHIRNFNRNLAILNDWARKDRHRQLHVVGSWGSNANPQINTPPGTSLAWIRVSGNGFLKDEYEVARFSIDGFVPGMEVEANPDMMIDIAVNEVPESCADNDTLSNRLTYIGETVEIVVAHIEKICLSGRGHIAPRSAGA